MRSEVGWRRAAYLAATQARVKFQDTMVPTEKEKQLLHQLCEQERIAESLLFAAMEREKRKAG